LITAGRRREQRKREERIKSDDSVGGVEQRCGIRNDEMGK
jgi:hypothetical protein